MKFSKSNENPVCNSSWNVKLILRKGHESEFRNRVSWDKTFLFFFSSSSVQTNEYIIYASLCDKQFAFYSLCDCYVNKK